MTREDRGFVDFVVDQLSDLKDVTAKPMFGGFGLYRGSTFFGIVYEERLYLKTDASTRGWYDERGSETFHPTPKQQLKNYLEVPADTLEDPESLSELVEEACDLG